MGNKYYWVGPRAGASASEGLAWHYDWSVQIAVMWEKRLRHLILALVRLQNLTLRWPRTSAGKVTVRRTTSVEPNTPFESLSQGDN